MLKMYFVEMKVLLIPTYVMSLQCLTATTAQPTAVNRPVSVDRWRLTCDHLWQSSHNDLKFCLERGKIRWTIPSKRSVVPIVLVVHRGDKYAGRLG